MEFAMLGKQNIICFVFVLYIQPSLSVYNFLGKPNPPEKLDYMDGSLTQTSVIITWMPGFHGGLNQTFHIKYKKQIDSKWQEVTKPDEGTANMTLSLSGLEPGTGYMFQLYSRNSEGSSNETEILTFTTIHVTVQSCDTLVVTVRMISTGLFDINITEKKTDGTGESAGLIGGVVTGTIIIIAIVISLIVVFKRKYLLKEQLLSRNPNDTDKSRQSNDAYMDLQNMRNGCQMNKDNTYENTHNGKLFCEKGQGYSVMDTHLYTELKRNVNHDKEHIYTKFEQQSSANDDQIVYENLKIKK